MELQLVETKGTVMEIREKLLQPFLPTMDKITDWPIQT